jgi:hypothetical protein
MINAVRQRKLRQAGHHVPPNKHCKPATATIAKVPFRGRIGAPLLFAR